MRILGLCVVVAAGCGGDDGGGDAAVGTTAHQFCVQETNRYRQMNSVAAVAESTELEVFANTGAMVDFAGSPHDHFRNTSGGGIAFAENECPHWPMAMDMSTLVASCIAAFYAEGPGADYNTHGHYINMMNASYTKLGCGIYQSGTMVTIVQDYGN